MTALVVPVRKRPPQDIASRAHRVLDAALVTRDLWTRDTEARQEIRQACEELDIALDDYRAIESGAADVEALYPDLVHAADPVAEALDRLAEEASVVSMILLMSITAAGGHDLAKAIIAVTAGGGDE